MLQNSVPYHKPKSHTLQEFLNRRSIVEHQQELNSKPIRNAAAAIKMSEMELIEYANKIDQRIQESEEFFQDEGTDEENESADEVKENSDVELADKTTEQSVDDNNQFPSDEITTENTVNDTDDTSKIIPSPKNPIEFSNEIIDIAMASQQTDIQQSNDLQANESSASQQEKVTNEIITNTIEFHTERTELDDELDKMEVVMPAKRKTEILSLANILTPKLEGDSGMMIDLETNEIKPKEKTGVDQLMERFVKNAFAKQIDSNIESQEIG